MDEHEHEHAHSGATGHSHNLDPSVFASSAATDEPIGYIMALHIAFMVTGSLATTLRELAGLTLLRTGIQKHSVFCSLWEWS